MTKPQKPHGLYPETQTYTAPSETESAHKHPLHSVTAVPPALSHTWTNDLPRELEKDGGIDEEHHQSTAVIFDSDPTAPLMWGNPDDNTTAYSDPNTSGTDSKEMESKDVSMQIEMDEDGESVERSLTEDDEHKNEEEVTMSRGNHILLVSTPHGTANSQILFHSVTLSLPAKQNTEAPPTPTQLSSEDNRDESREKISSENEQITEPLQVITPTKVTEDQAKLFEKHTPTTRHTHTTTRRLSEDKEAADTESQDEEEHSDEDNLQTSAEIEDSFAGQTTTLNAITLTSMTSHLLPTQHIEAKAPITPSQVTSTLSLKTTNIPITQQTLNRLTTHTSLTNPFTPSAIQTQTTHRTKSPHTSQTLLMKPTITHKTSVMLQQNPGGILSIPVIHNHKTELRPLHTPKPNTAQFSSATTTQGYSEEEEEEEEKYEEIKKELLDSSQEAKSKSKSETKMLRHTGMP